MNTYVGLILANTTVALPFAITILRPFFLSIPKEISEAARIDGCSPLQAFLWTMLPVSTPGIFTIGIFTFLSSWGDLLFGLTIITVDTMRPVTAGLWKFIGSNVSQWNMVMGFWRCGGDTRPDALRQRLGERGHNFADFNVGDDLLAEMNAVVRDTDELAHVEPSRTRRH